MDFEGTAFEGAEETSVEETEVAEPSSEATEEGVEEQGNPEPASEEPEKPGRTAADAAFAEMRRRAEEAERKNAEAQAELESLKAKQAARQAALANMDIDEIDAIAESAGITREDVLEQLAREEEAAEAEIESKAKDQEIESLRARINEVEAEKVMTQDLATLQQIDPTIKSLEDLGDDYAAYILAGLTAEQAYYAIKSKELATKPAPAKSPGKVTDSTPPEKDYFTEEEVDNMTPAEQRKHHKKIIESMSKW